MLVLECQCTGRDASSTSEVSRWMKKGGHPVIDFIVNVGKACEALEHPTISNRQPYLTPRINLY